VMIWAREGSPLNRIFNQGATLSPSLFMDIWSSYQSQRHLIIPIESRICFMYCKQKYIYLKRIQSQVLDLLSISIRMPSCSFEWEKNLIEIFTRSSTCEFNVFVKNKCLK
jgi:hypothetical protein